MAERKIMTYMQWRQFLRTGIGSDIQIPILPDYCEIRSIEVVLDKRQGELTANFIGTMKSRSEVTTKFRERLMGLVKTKVFTRIEALTYEHPPTKLTAVGKVVMTFRVGANEDATLVAVRCVDEFLKAVGVAKPLKDIERPNAYQMTWYKRNGQWVPYGHDAVERYLLRMQVVGAASQS